MTALVPVAPRKCLAELSDRNKVWGIAGLPMTLHPQVGYLDMLNTAYGDTVRNPDGLAYYRYSTSKDTDTPGVAYRKLIGLRDVYKDACLAADAYTDPHHPFWRIEPDTCDELQRWDTWPEPDPIRAVKHSCPVGFGWSPVHISYLLKAGHNRVSVAIALNWPVVWMQLEDG